MRSVIYVCTLGHGRPHRPTLQAHLVLVDLLIMCLRLEVACSSLVMAGVGGWRGPAWTE